MSRTLADEERYAIEQVGNGASLMRYDFTNPPREGRIKNDGSPVLPTDGNVSKLYESAYACRDTEFQSEEGVDLAKSPSGEDMVVVTDPLDGTRDFIAGQQRHPKFSTAATSIGLWRADGFVVGVVAFPLLGVDTITYSAHRGGGACRRISSTVTRLQIDIEPARGIVFVSMRPNAALLRNMETMQAAGLTPIPVDGAVFKACALVDASLLDILRASGAMGTIPNMPVVGYVSGGVHIHDRAATSCIIEEAGGYVTPSIQNDGKKHPFVAANNRQVFEQLSAIRGVQL